MRTRWGAALVMALWVGCLAGAACAAQITNPVIADAADPFITRAGDEYLLLATHANTITIWSGKTLAETARNPKVVWKPADAMKQVWSPTLWKMGERWWIYFTAASPAPQSTQPPDRIHALLAQEPPPRPAGSPPPAASASPHAPSAPPHPPQM